MKPATYLTAFLFLLLAINLTFFPTAHPTAYPQPKRTQLPQALSANEEAKAIMPLAEAKGEQRIVVVLAEFPDRKHVVRAEKIRDIVFEDLDGFIREVSYGLAWVTGDITSKWYEIATPLARLDIQKWETAGEKDTNTFLREAVKAADEEVNFRGYDFVVIVGAGKVWPNAKCSFTASTNDGVNSLRGFVVNEYTQMGVYAHELGHVLPTSIASRNGCGLPDMYSYEAGEQDLENWSPWIGPWDLMDWDDPARSFSAWSKISLGWLKPEVKRLSPTAAFIIDLQPLETESGVRAVVVPITAKTSYVIEVRRRIGYDKVLPSEGVLVYYVDLGKESGYGVLTVIDAKKNTESLEDAAFRKGQTFVDAENHVYVLVAETDGFGFTVAVSGIKIYSLKDSDQDGLLDDIETALATDFRNSDTDGDGLKDGEEVNTYGTNPLNSDSDNDGLADREEVNLGTDPLESDTDSDGLMDGREVELGTNPKMNDSDADGLLDGDEITRGTDPLESDSDDDGLPDGKEIQRGTDPLKPDSDGDGLTDGREINLGTNPLNVDTDGDSWPDGADFAPTSALMPNVLILAALIAVALVFIGFRKRRKTTPQTEVSAVASVTARFCVNCGASLPVGSRFCQNCGAQQ